MPETKTIKLSYKGSVKPAKTSFLTPSDIPMNFDAELDLEDSDIANAKTVEKEFQTAMDRQIDAQLSALNTWLAEKDKQIADMVKRFETLQKQGFPDSPQEANARAKTLADLAKIGILMDSLPKQWSDLVKDWASNTCDQQGLVAMKLAVKAARITVFSDKNFRMRAGQVTKATLVIAGVALGVAAMIVTAGAATPLVLAITGAALALSSGFSLGGLGKSLYENATAEKKLLNSVAKDVETVREAFGAADTTKSAIAKHVTELGNLIKMREDVMKDLQQEIKKASVAADSMAKQMAKLDDQSLDGTDFSKRQKVIDGMLKDLDDAKAQLAKLAGQNADAQALLKDLEDMVGDISTLSLRPANTIAGNLKKRLSSLDGIMELTSKIRPMMGPVAQLVK